MEQRPKISIELSRLDKALEYVSWVIFALLCVYTTWNYFHLPDTIAIHFDSKGVANNYGHKATIFILPGIAIIVMALLTVINRYPHIFNYPVKLTAENAQRQYTLATRLMRMIKLVVAATFFTTVVELVQSAKGQHWLGMLLIPVILIATSLPLIWYFVAAGRDK